MRANLVSPSSAQLSYAIRDIVKFGELVRRHGVDDHLGEHRRPDRQGREGRALDPRDRPRGGRDRGLLGLLPHRGLHGGPGGAGRARQRAAGARVTAADIIFFNGVADAVAKVYGFLSAHARVIGPSPAYSTHSSAESAHCALPHITYDLDPENGWMPDLADLRRKIESYPSIAGILIINPNNPTGAVYPAEVLEEIVALAREFGLFLIADEIYIHMVFPGVRDRPPLRGGHRRAGHRHARHLQGTALAGLALRLDRGAQPVARPELLRLRRFAGGGQAAGGLLHQRAAAGRAPHLRRPPLRRPPGRARARCSRRGPRRPTRPCSAVPGLKVNPAQGAFYMTALFEPGVLNGNNRLPIANPELREIVERQCKGAAPDARFVYHLLASTGICVVPLSGFCSPHPGLPLHPARDRRRQAGAGSSARWPTR